MATELERRRLKKVQNENQRQADGSGPYVSPGANRERMDTGGILGRGGWVRENLKDSWRGLRDAVIKPVWEGMAGRTAGEHFDRTSSEAQGSREERNREAIRQRDESRAAFGTRPTVPPDRATREHMMTPEQRAEQDRIYNEPANDYSPRDFTAGFGPNTQSPDPVTLPQSPLRPRQDGIPVGRPELRGDTPGAQMQDSLQRHELGQSPEAGQHHGGAEGLRRAWETGRTPVLQGYTDPQTGQHLGERMTGQDTLPPDAQGAFNADGTRRELQQEGSYADQYAQEDRQMVQPMVRQPDGTYRQGTMGEHAGQVLRQYRNHRAGHDVASGDPAQNRDRHQSAMRQMFESREAAGKLTPAERRERDQQVAVGERDKDRATAERIAQAGAAQPGRAGFEAVTIKIGDQEVAYGFDKETGVFTDPAGQNPFANDPEMAAMQERYGQLRDATGMGQTRRDKQMVDLQRSMAEYAKQQLEELQRGQPVAQRPLPDGRTEYRDAQGNTWTA